MSLPPSDIDQGSADLIEQIQLEDEADAVYSADSSDGYVPFRTSLAELQAAPDPHANWRRGRSLDPEYADDETLIQMGILYPQPDPQSGSAQAEQAEQAEQSGKGKQAEHAMQAEQPGQPESSTHAARRGDKSPTRTRKCIICFQEKDILDTTSLPCGDDCCSECITDFFSKALVDESLFPPQCCQQPIPFSQARIFLKKSLVEKYEKKKVELETPTRARTYCHIPECRTFIEPATIPGVVATCPACTAETCTRCKSEVHTGPCDDVQDTQQFQELAQERGWKKCYNCGRMVERKYGCEHMRCRCGAHFCYECGAPWMPGVPHRHSPSYPGQDGEINFRPHVFPVFVTDREASGLQTPPDEEEDDADDNNDGDDEDEDGNEDEDEEEDDDEVGQMIDVYYDPRERSPSHEEFQREIDEHNAIREERDAEEDGKTDEDSDVFYDAQEYIDDKENEGEGTDVQEGEMEDINVDPNNPLGEPIGEPVLDEPDEPFDPQVEEHAADFVHERWEEQRQEQLQRQRHEQLQEQTRDESEDIESEVEQISDSDERARRVMEDLGIDCEHLRWAAVYDIGRCGDCMRDPPSRRYRCSQCGIMVCATCRMGFVQDLRLSGRLPPWP